MQTKKSLLSSLEILFKPKEQLGYWDSENSRIIGKIVHDSEWNWHVYDDKSDRYGFFCLSMLLIANMNFNLNLSKYLPKIRKYIDYISENIMDSKLSDISYGGFNCIVLAHILNFKKSENQIISCLERIKKEIKNINDNETSLIIIGLSNYLRYIDPLDEDTKNYLGKLVNKLLDSQNSRGYFETGDIRYNYHQRTMYTLWALIFSSLVLEDNRIRSSVEKTINYVWENMRAKKDDAFHWHPSIYTCKLRWGIRVPIVSISSSFYLFECHQSFFANAIKFHKLFFGSDIFTEYQSRSVNWIFGSNRIETNLVEITGLNIPARIMKTNGELFVPNQNFKGSYELGSFILQLSDNQKKGTYKK